MALTEQTVPVDMIADDFWYIESSTELERWVEYIADAKWVAVDTEADSMYHYHEQVCLIQMSAKGSDAIIDPLAIHDLSSLDRIMSQPTVMKIFHDAGYDLVGLRRDFGFETRGIVDTMLASRLLGEKRFGLAALLEKYFGIETDKKWQRSNWVKRPLLPDQLRYARHDTQHLEALAELLIAQLRAKNRLGWLWEDCERYPEKVQSWSPSARSDPEGWWLLKGVRQFSAESKGRARSLFKLRDRIAHKLDRPPFKVFSDTMLLDMAKKTPESLAALEKEHKVRGRLYREFGASILEALQNAQPIGQKYPPDHLRRRKAGRYLSESARLLLKELKVLRKRIAESLGIEPEVLLPNSVLEGLAERPIESAHGLADQSPFDGWRGPLLIAPFETLLRSHAGAASLDEEADV